MSTPTALTDHMEELLESLQTNNAETRRAAAVEAVATSRRLRSMAHLGFPALVEEYCGYFEMHVERLASVSDTPDGNHNELLGAMTALAKLRGEMGFDLN